ncbi:TerC/Alx family metal homeostasis membrane protein [Arthrobacter sp. JZ12]|uniref:TerC family protein n=1 Tax=Arthrobacter sp. JZ12 TaxID=2654190 RepID=UPI002B49D52D|nr:TerC/Alx family metal homeostasis membrane protein [Arthrobacter sp. JZ12]WRH25931.1 TerC/Alx family metal homeostasis membrane protein [Arthrobacter sp. JZ12]
MEVPFIVWILTVAGIVGLLLFDFFFHVRKAHTPSLKEASVWSAIYVGIALLFGVGVLVFAGPDFGAEYFAGYITEKALSVDNLFVFLIIMTTFKVPRADQQKVLLFGIVFSLIARTGFIFLGAALINSFAWVFYIFGLILLITAGNILKPKNVEEEETFFVRAARKFLPATEHYDGDKLFTIEDGKKVLTPMLLVMVAIGGTDILFALDSIPAIFGLTQSVFIVFTATAFSLMGLRQLYFLIDGLLDRLIYLSYGLAAILGFIGIKLILHALHENNVPFINNGEHVEVVEISTGLSLSVILGVLIVTVVASLLSPKGKAKNLISGARRHAIYYLDLNYETDINERERIFNRMCAEEEMLRKQPEKYKRFIRNETEFMALLKRAHEEHEAALEREPSR